MDELEKKLSEFISRFKFPLVLAALGLIFFFIAIVLLLKNTPDSPAVEFSDQATSSAKTKMKIDIAGSVIVPGVYELPEGSRVTDAIATAGGLSANADKEYIAKSVNQAARLTDGAKIYIPSVKEVSSGQNLSNLGNLSDFGKKKVNLNTASQSELEVLPGVGPVTAGKIISGRPYQTVDELKTRKIVAASLFEKTKDLLTIF